MRNSKSLIITMLVLMGSFLLTCQKEKVEPVLYDTEVAFTIGIPQKSGRLKSGYTLASAEKVIISIKNADNSPTAYSSTDLKILQMNGSFYTQKILLKTGSYKLTEFLVLDSSGNTIFTAPVTGSREAMNVNTPLPISFIATKNLSTTVNVEVLSTENKVPEDFGFSQFPITEVKTLSFMIGVLDKESDILTTARLTVSNGSYSITQDLSAVTNNVVTVRENLSSYTLKVEKTNYITYTYTFTADSLRHYENKSGNVPLIIELKKITELLMLKGSPSDKMMSIYKMTPEGNNISLVISEGYWTDNSAVWSNDKTRILYTSQNSTTTKTEVFLVNADGTNNTQITTDNPYYYNTSAVFRSDSKIWYFNNQSMVSGEITEINYNGTGKTKISNFNADLAKVFSFSVNKTATRICYYKQKILDPGKIYIANIDFTGERRLTTGTAEERYPQFSPDGLRIVYTKTTSGDVNNVFVVNSDGTGDTQLTSYTNSTHRIDYPRWSPDGKKIAYSFFDGAQWDIWTMNSNGTEKVNVTNTSGFNEVVTDWK